jgi:chemotaxis protein MotB
MAGDNKKLQPIVVKRIKKASHGHHGGAWKIAYADFVTAMMAFFLLMWLLGSTTDGDKKGIADYFNSPLRVSLMGGSSGAGDASHVIKGGGTDLTRSSGQVKKGDIEAKRDTINLLALKDELAAAERARLKQLKDELEHTLVSLPQLAEFRSQVKIDITRDGLRIQILDDRNRPTFASGSSVVQPYMRDLLRALGPVLGSVPNKLTLEGHTDAAPFAAGEQGYSNWELSADRANASRRELVAAGLADDRVMRVQGLASSIPFDHDNPLNPINRRISITVMYRDAERQLHAPAQVDDVDEAASAVVSTAALNATTARP